MLCAHIMHQKRHQIWKHGKSDWAPFHVHTIVWSPHLGYQVGPPPGASRAPHPTPGKRTTFHHRQGTPIHAIFIAGIAVTSLSTSIVSLGGGVGLDGGVTVATSTSGGWRRVTTLWSSTTMRRYLIIKKGRANRIFKGTSIIARCLMTPSVASRIADYYWCICEECNLDLSDRVWYWLGGALPEEATDLSCWNSLVITQHGDQATE